MVLMTLVGPWIQIILSILICVSVMFMREKTQRQMASQAK